MTKTRLYTWWHGSHREGKRDSKRLKGKERKLVSNLKANAWREKVEREKKEAERKLAEEIKKLKAEMATRGSANGHGVRGSRGSNRPRGPGGFVEPPLPV